MDWLELANDALSDRFSCVSVYGVPLNHKSKTFYSSFLKCLLS
jgi:hypothetical protein